MDDTAVEADDDGVLRWAWTGRVAAIAVGGAGLLVGVGYALYARLPSLWSHLFWTGLVVVPLFVVAVWLIRRRPDHPQARRLLITAASAAVGVGIESVMRGAYQEGSADSWLWAANLAHQCTSVVATIAGGALLAYYPDGAVERGWQRRAVRAMWWLVVVPPLVLVTLPYLSFSPYLFDPPPSAPVASPVAIAGLEPVGRILEVLYVSSIPAVLGVAILVMRYVQAGPRLRQQMRPLIYTMIAAVPVAGAIAAMELLGVPEDSVWFQAIGLLYLPIGLMIPVSIVIGVLRYRLFDIDLVIRRSVVYGVLSVGIAAIYVGLAAAPGLALGTQIPVDVAVVVTVGAALVFHPLRQRLEVLARRWAFGDRADRYRVVTSFGAMLEQVVDLTDLLPRLADTVRRGMGAAWVRVELRGEGPGSWLAEPQGVAGVPSGPAALSEQLRHAEDVVGRIECGPSEARYDDADRELLATLAGQAATAIANVRLTATLRERLDELARSRARIVAAQDTERRRIERDIHDGVQQQVVALIMKVRLARNRVGRGEPPEGLLAEVQSDATELLTDLRELAHGIHPPVLTDGGLVAAVEARVGRLPLGVIVSAEDGLRDRRLDTDVEAAAYFVVCEALTNVVKHAQAREAVVSLTTTDGRLWVLVSDDGLGLAGGAMNGHGLTNLRDRVEALGGRVRIDDRPGGGTRLSADLPAGARHG